MTSRIASLSSTRRKRRRVRLIFRRYLGVSSVGKLWADLDHVPFVSKQHELTSGRVFAGCSFGRGALYHLLQNRLYRGKVVHKGIARVNV